MTTVLVIKTAALGDVLRTTSILRGLKRRFDTLHLTWLTSRAARPLVERHELVERVVTCDTEDPISIAEALGQLREQKWDWILSLDDEEPLCTLAAALQADKLSGATLDGSGLRVYTDDVEPWFGMGLLSRDGRETADARKLANERTHPEIFASMLGVEPGRPELPLPETAITTAQEFAGQHGLAAERLVVGLNTGASGRWKSKALPAERTVAFAKALAALDELRPIDFLVFGGPTERDRNDRILAGIGELGHGARAIDPGTDNDIPEFAALLSLCDVLVASDSLALHLGVALGVPLVAFFAPTSAAEIELYDNGEKVVSTDDDYCSYRPDASNESITVERLVDATQRTLEASGDRQWLVDRPST